MNTTALSTPSRHKRANALAGTLSAILCALALAGCQSGTQAASLSEEIDGDSAQAMVTSVDGDKISVSVMTGGPGQNSDGNPPEAPADASGSGASGSDAASKQDSASDSDAASKQDSKSESSTSESNASGSSADSESDSASDSSASKPDAGDSSDTSKPGSESGSDGDASQSGNGNGQDGEPPAKPEGEANGQDGQPPEMPDGNAPGGTEMTLTISDESIIYTSADGNESQASLSDITEGSMLQLSVDNGTTVTKIVIGNGNGGPGGAPDGNGQGSDTVNNGSGATTIDSDTTAKSESYESANADENALRVENGANATISDATITKTGDSSNSGDSDFYGLNAAVLAYDGSNLTLSDASIESDSAGSNGVFAYGEGTEVTVSDSTIKNTAGNSGGIEVAGGATLTASNLDVDTQGESSAAIRSDRGGGTETVTGGSYATHGGHSPAVYSTANVTVKDAKLSAENTEGIVIEGKNSVTLDNCDLTGNINGIATRTDVVNNVMIYQSMSGDASEGTGSFTMKGGSFKAEHGYLFYVTNTDATIDLDDVSIDNTEGQLLMVAGNDGQWGTQGSNGGVVAFTASDQTLSGSITVDSSSSLSLKLSNSAYTGAINTDGAAGTVDVALSDNATWKLDGDSHVNSLSGDTSGIDLNGHTLYVNGEAWSA